MEQDDPSTSVAPERELVERAAHGDTEAFAALYRAQVDVVYGFLRFRAGADRADDLTAETFCRAWAAIGRYEWTGAPFRAWLMRIAFHLLISESRRAGAKDLLQGELDAGATRSHDEDVVSALRIRQLIAKLPAHQQSVVDLRFLRDLDVAETAMVLGMTEEAVRSATYRALQALRRFMKETPDA